MAKDGIELVSVTNHFKFEAPDGKQRVSDALDAECVQTLAKHYPNTPVNLSQNMVRCFCPFSDFTLAVTLKAEVTHLSALAEGLAAISR